MGFFEALFGNEDDDRIRERDVVNDMLKDSKFALHSLIVAISESRNPEVRKLLKRQFNAALHAHFQLADIAVDNEWYHPFMTPKDQLEEDTAHVGAAIHLL